MIPINTLRSRIDEQATKAALFSFTTAVITIVALVVIATSVICLTLRGVNALSQVIYPAFLPAVGLLLLTTPFAYLSYHYQQIQSKNWEALLEKLKEKIDSDFPAVPKKEQSTWLIENVLGGEKNIIRAQNLFTSLKKFYPEKKDPTVKAFDDAFLLIADADTTKKSDNKE